MSADADSPKRRNRIAERREAAIDRMADARGAAADHLADARAAAADRAADARASATEHLADARAAAADLLSKRPKPRLRGVFHQWAFFASLALGAGLILLATGAEARLAVAIYAASLSALFGVSALYHRVTWRRVRARMWMRRLDHAMIFLLIAGTVTPFAILVLDGPFATALLVAVWAGALAGAIVEVAWVGHPKWVAAIVYIAVGSIGAIGFPVIVAETGPLAGALIALGGALYITGAIIYAAQRPDPRPAVFGYHEIFHALVIAAAAAHFAAIALFALPAAS
ncbi:MAG TPA: hemolysin III family protein [Solirubrobacterales bacterium]|nr:hemolysin III family protein [Solirubrobacterales bacterium]